MHGIARRLRLRPRPQASAMRARCTLRVVWEARGASSGSLRLGLGPRHRPNPKLLNPNLKLKPKPRRRPMCTSSSSSSSSSPSAAAATAAEPPPKISTSQFRRLMLSAAVPMVGFGFADNFVMIVAGDFIDNLSLWRALALSTLAAAGLGNLVSDLVGVGMGNVIEDLALRYGMAPPALSARQLSLRAARLAKGLGTCVGISIGCVLGMTPLLFSEKDPELAALSHLSKAELRLYNQCFRDFTVAPEQFANMLRYATWHEAKPGETIVKQGSYLTHVIMLYEGTADAFPGDMVEGGDHDLANMKPSYTYTPTYQNGSNVIGASRIVDGTCRSRTYPNEVIASYNADRVLYIMWDYHDLDNLMKSNPAIKAAVLNSLCRDLFTGIRKMQDDGRLDLNADSGGSGASPDADPNHVRQNSAELLKHQVVMNARLLEEVVRLKREVTASGKRRKEEAKSKPWNPLGWTLGAYSPNNPNPNPDTNPKPHANPNLDQHPNAKPDDGPKA
eukprot:CAMPEP_0118887298 /NCGR_PEP_ID=MMETSP1163-20130328/25051_1 /TAXON_ID=124430 /ORGANISM="Phaeomonas parva, Strain CCMP2877" /LENGTH=502 /DNA_ID=CAMNT_0006825703 /DNA_START=378 /DNA_END=1886 /DNA_ORIENTATION=+